MLGRLVGAGAVHLEVEDSMQPSGGQRDGSAARRACAASRAPFRFTGNASEYFRIWIVNTLLTIDADAVPWVSLRNAAR